MTDIKTIQQKIEEKVKEFDGLELRTTQGRPPYDIVVNRKDVHKFIEDLCLSIAQEARQEGTAYKGKAVREAYTKGYNEGKQEGAKEERERIKQEAQQMIIKANDEVLALDDHDERRVAGRHYRFMLGKQAAFYEFCNMVDSLSPEQTPEEKKTLGIVYGQKFVNGEEKEECHCHCHRHDITLRHIRCDSSKHSCIHCTISHSGEKSIKF